MCPVVLPILSKNLGEQMKLAHKVVDVVDRPKRKIFVTLLPYTVDKPESSYAQVGIIARKRKDERFQRGVSVKYKLQEVFFLLDVMLSLCDISFDDQPLCNVFYKENSSEYSLSFSFYSNQDE